MFVGAFNALIDRQLISDVTCCKQWYCYYYYHEYYAFLF